MHPHDEYGINNKTMLKLYIILIIRIRWQTWMDPGQEKERIVKTPECSAGTWHTITRGKLKK
jgi:hypothetical protein